MPKRKVALVHPQLGFGGSEAAVLWSLQSLKGNYDLTLITEGPVDLLRLNQYYGTSLGAEDFSFRRIPMPSWLEGSGKFAALRGRFALRYVRRVAPEFDVLISFYGPMDCGRPCIQRVVDFSFVEEWRLDLHPIFRRWKAWFYGPTMVRRAYLRLCDRIAPLNPDAWKHNVTHANSYWTADRLLERYGIASQVIYSPVAIDVPHQAYWSREKGFIFLGRITPEKCAHSAIEILRRVRERGHDVHLHILGGMDNSDYAKKVRRLAEHFSEWVFLEGWAWGDRKRELLAGHRFGINACPNEAFGIAVAEMVLAGCIVFVPSGGGQVEIINHPALIYEHDADAVEKIDAILTREEEQEELCRHLRLAASSFSAKTFAEAMRHGVAEFMERHVSAL
jgi:glycosyltransferase involved in cell wall biosynthesis